LRYVFCVGFYPLKFVHLNAVHFIDLSLPKSSSLSENCCNLVLKLTFEYGHMLEELVSGKMQICLCCGGGMQAAAAAAVCILLRNWQTTLMGSCAVHICYMILS